LLLDLHGVSRHVHGCAQGLVFLPVFPLTFLRAVRDHLTAPAYFVSNFSAVGTDASVEIAMLQGALLHVNDGDLGVGGKNWSALVLNASAWRCTIAFVIEEDNQRRGGRHKKNKVKKTFTG